MHSSTQLENIIDLLLTIRRFSEEQSSALTVDHASAGGLPNNTTVELISSYSEVSTIIGPG
jgi:hypothetical protein